MASMREYNEILSTIRQNLSESVEAAETEEVEEATDLLDQFLADNAVHVAREVGLSEDEALDLVFAVAENLEKEGALLSLPDLGESAEDWIKDAKGINFALQAVQEARVAEARRMDKEFGSDRNDRMANRAILHATGMQGPSDNPEWAKKRAALIGKLGVGGFKPVPNALKSPKNRKTPKSAQ